MGKRKGGRIGNFEIGFVFKAQCVNFWIARAVMRCVSTRTPPQAFTRTCDDGISQDLVVYRRRRFVRCPPDRAFLIQTLSHFHSYLETTRSKSDCHFSPRFRLEKRVAADNFRIRLDPIFWKFDEYVKRGFCYLKKRISI